jgi:hypothetical protein
VPYRSSAQIPHREEVGVSFLAHRPIRTANSTSLISISRHLAPFDKVSWKVITQKCLFQSSAPVHLWAPERSRIVDLTSQYYSWSSNKLHPGDVACASKKSTILLSV